MFTRLIEGLRAARVPVGVSEHLLFLAALKAGEQSLDAEGFYYLARAALVKDERYFDRFDRVFAETFKGLEPPPGAGADQAQPQLPDDWLKALAERVFSEEERALVQRLGGLDKLLQALEERLREQHKRHEGGNRMIGTGGTSPFGAMGYNPEGIRIGQPSGRHGRAVKVWDERAFRDLDADGALTPRATALALRSLRRYAREGAAEELDLDDTIRATAANAGWLDVKMRRERRNATRLVLLLDVGGSMDPFVTQVAALFHGIRHEFKNLETFYFHNCVYDWLWPSARRRATERLATHDVLRRFNAGWHLIVVGDAAMSPYELTAPGGSTEYANQEPGLVWLQRLTQHFTRVAWLNPMQEAYWPGSVTVAMIRDLMGGAMFPLTPAGIERAVFALKGRGVVQREFEQDSQPDTL